MSCPASPGWAAPRPLSLLGRIGPSSLETLARSLPRGERRGDLGYAGVMPAGCSSRALNPTPSLGAAGGGVEVLLGAGLHAQPRSITHLPRAVRSRRRSSDLASFLFFFLS